MKSVPQSVEVLRGGDTGRTVPGDGGPPSILARRELIARIVASPTFGRSERLSSLLAFVCEMNFQRRDREINEQCIGQAVFGRSSDYDSSVDGIVRTQASRLRQRLQLYFEHEGAQERLRITIPRGGYIPVFEPVADPIPNPAAEAISEPPTELAETERAAPSVARLPVPGSRPSSLPWLVALGLALALVISFLVNRGVLAISPFAHAPEHPLWSRMFLPGHQTMEVPGDSGLVMYHGMSKQETSLDDYLRGAYRLPPPAGATPWQALQADMANRRYTAIVDVEAAQALNRLAQARGASLAVRYARDVRPNDLKAGNVVLVGAAQANPWVLLYERTMNFFFVDDLNRHVFSVVNRSPQPGEPRQFDSAVDDPQHRVYGVVAFLPNLQGDGDTLILEGTSMAGTESALDFVTDDKQLLPFLNRLRHPDGSIPHFEAVVGTNNVSASAAHSTVLAWRVAP